MDWAVDASSRMALVAGSCTMVGVDFSTGSMAGTGSVSGSITGVGTGLEFEKPLTHR